jgi:hypothetical protein
VGSSVMEKVKIQARVLIPLVKALQAELDEERANALVRRTVRSRRTAAGWRGPAKGPHHQNRWEILTSNTEQEAANGTGVRPAPEAEMATSFRLRPERPHVARLSRKVLIGGYSFGADSLVRCRFPDAANTREAGSCLGRILLDRSPQCGRQACEPTQGLRLNSTGRATTGATARTVADALERA